MSFADIMKKEKKNEVFNYYHSNSIYIILRQDSFMGIGVLQILDWLFTPQDKCRKDWYEE